MSIQPLTQELAKSFGITGTQGALVASVSEDSPAARAGLKEGDVIVTFDGKPVEGPRVLPAIVANTPIGRAVPVGIVRDGSRQTVTVTVGNLTDSREARAAPAEKGPESRATEKLGLALQELTPELAKQLGVQGDKGVVVTEVKPDSPAAQAGLAAGDVIREVNRTAGAGAPGRREGPRPRSGSRAGAAPRRAGGLPALRGGRRGVGGASGSPLSVRGAGRSRPAPRRLVRLVAARAC